METLNQNWQWRGYLFSHKNLRLFLKVFYQLKLCGKIVAHQYRKNRKRVMKEDPTVRFEYAAP